MEYLSLLIVIFFAIVDVLSRWHVRLRGLHGINLVVILCKLVVLIVVAIIHGLRRSLLYILIFLLWNECRRLAIRIIRRYKWSATAKIVSCCTTYIAWLERLGLLHHLLLWHRGLSCGRWSEGTASNGHWHRSRRHTSRWLEWLGCWLEFLH